MTTCFLRNDHVFFFSGEDGFFTVAEIEVLEKKIAEIEAWKETAVKEQEGTVYYCLYWPLFGRAAILAKIRMAKKHRCVGFA